MVSTPQWELCCLQLAAGLSLVTLQMPKDSEGAFPSAVSAVRELEAELAGRGAGGVE